MIVLTRHRYQKIRIGDDITVTVVEIGRDKVLLSFDAPKEVEIYRQEIYDLRQKRKEGTQ